MLMKFNLEIKNKKDSARHSKKVLIIKLLIIISNIGEKIARLNNNCDSSNF